MIYNVCLCCGRGRCRCAATNTLDWRAPIVSLDRALRQHVSADDVLVYNDSDGMKSIFADPDWDMSLETY